MAMRAQRSIAKNFMLCYLISTTNASENMFAVMYAHIYLEFGDDRNFSLGLCLVNNTDLIQGGAS